MKLVYVSDAVYPYNKGGKEKRLYELSTRLAKLGHDVHIYTMHWWNGPEQKRTENGVTLHAISPLYPLYKGDKRSIRQGVMFGLHCLKLVRVRWDVLDVDHMPFFPVYSAWLVCRINTLLRRPAALRTFHGTWHEALSRKDWTDYMGALGLVSYAIEHMSIKLPDHITAASEHTARGLSAKHGRSRNVHVVPNGIDLDAIKSADQPASQTTACDVLYIGRLVKDKNVNLLIEAIGVLRPDFPNIRCRIIGHGIENNNLRGKIASLKLDKHITLDAPLKDEAGVYGAMKAARVFCQPSIREGFGITVLEALGCGTPVVTTNAEANAAKDLVREGITGSLVSADAKSIAGSLRKWLSRAKPRRIAESVGSYDWNALAERQVEVYGL